MYNGNVGGVSGGNENVRWSRELAEQLDAADGQKDGIIKKNIWDGFLKQAGSSGNTVKWGISIENAMKSFEYYDKKKDVGKVDWGNWQAMLDKFTGKETPAAGGVTEVTAHPPVSPVTTGDEPKVTQQQQADFEKAMQDAKFADKFPSAEELKADGWQQAYIEKRPYGNVTYTNADGSTITESDSRADNPINPGKDYTRTLKYTDKNGTTNMITYNKDGKPIQGTLTMKQADGTSVEYKYTYDSAGKKVLQGCKTLPVSGENGSGPVVDKREKVEITKDYKDNGDGTFTKTSLREDGKPGFKQTVDKNGTVLSESEFRLGINEGKEIEIRRNYFPDGSIEKLAFVDGEQMESFYDGEMPLLGELQFKAKNSPLKIIDGKIPTEAELLQAGYKRDSSVMTMNGGVIYHNEQTGESILVDRTFNTVEYKNGNLTQRHSYDSNGNLIHGTLEIKGQNGAFETYAFDPNILTGKLEVISSNVQPAIISQTDYAMSAIDGHFDNIRAFREELGFPENNFPDLNEMLINETTGVGYAEQVSADGKHKIGVIANPSGDIDVTFSEKQADGTYKTVGAVKMTKQDSPSSLRGFDYMFEAMNLKTGNNRVISSANWNDFS